MLLRPRLRNVLCHLVVGATLLLTSLPAAAQPTEAPTNIEALQNLAVACVADAVPDSMQSFRLDAPDRMPYLRSALVDRWQAENRLLYLADTTSTDLPTLAYAVETVDVRYARSGRRTVARTVRLALRYSLTAPDGRLLRDTRCQDAYTDTIRRDAIAALEAEAFPETQGEVPPGGWFRRYAQPAIVAAATVVTVYLFFSLRSDRADN